MSGRIPLLAAVITTICGAGAIALALLGANGWLGKYTWPGATVIWCWSWYAATRTNRKLMGGAR